MSETLDDRIVRLKHELAEAHAEKRQLELAKLFSTPGVVVKPRMKPGPRRKPAHQVIPLGKVRRVIDSDMLDPDREWLFEVEFCGELIQGPARATAGEAADDLTKWRASEAEKDRVAREALRREQEKQDDKLPAWSPLDSDGRQTCLECAGVGEHDGRDCTNCNGDGYRWP